MTYSNVPEAALGVGDFFTDIVDAGGNVLGNLWGKAEETANKVVDSAPGIIAKKADEALNNVLTSSPANPDTALPINPTNSPAVGATVQVSGQVAPKVTTGSSDIMDYAEMPIVAGGIAAGGAKLAGMSWLNSLLIGLGSAVAVPYVIKNYVR